MRYVKGSLLIIFSLFVGLLISNQHGKADDYEIDNYQVLVNIQKNGDATVTQKIKYDFDGDFHGVYYNQDLKGIGGVIDEPTIAVQPAEGASKKLTINRSQQPQTVLLTKTTDQLKMKVFYPISDDQATFIYRHRLRGVVTNYADTAELNWKIIGTGWDVPQKNVKITIQLPATKIKQLQAWTHGLLNGHTTVDQQAGRVTMTVAKNPANQFVESHLLFPTTVTASNPYKVDKRVKQSKRQQEAKLAAAANRKRQRQSWLAGMGALGALLISVVVWLFNWRWQRKVPVDIFPAVTPINHSYEIPPITAAKAQVMLTNEVPDQKSFSATLLEWAAQKRLSITEDANNREPTYKLTALDPQLTEDPAIMQRLFKAAGDGQTVTLRQIKDYGKTSHGATLVTDYQDWQDAVLAEVTETEYLSGNNLLVRQRAGISALVGTVAGGIMLFCLYFTRPGIISWAGVLTVLFVLSGIGYWLWQRHRLSPYTESGAEKVAQLRGFKRMLADIGHFDVAQVGDLILWEQILPYAVAFGYAKRVIKALRANFTEEELAVGLGIYYPIYFGYHNLDFTSSFSEGFGGGITAGSPNDSSGIGGSGGFSGGSSGGFGGGSGGGAF